MVVIKRWLLRLTLFFPSVASSALLAQLRCCCVLSDTSCPQWAALPSGRGAAQRREQKRLLPNSHSCRLMPASPQWRLCSQEQMPHNVKEAPARVRVLQTLVCRPSGKGWNSLRDDALASNLVEAPSRPPPPHLADSNFRPLHCWQSRAFAREQSLRGQIPCATGAFQEPLEAYFRPLFEAINLSTRKQKTFTGLCLCTCTRIPRICA